MWKRGIGRTGGVASWLLTHTHTHTHTTKDNSHPSSTTTKTSYNSIIAIRPATDASRMPVAPSARSAGPAALVPLVVRPTPLVGAPVIAVPVKVMVVVRPFMVMTVVEALP